MKINADIKHISYTDTEAIEFAKSKGLETGTAKDVATKANIPMDYSKVSQLCQQPTIDSNGEYAPFNDCNWSYELDEFLRPYENIAKEFGIMMTPVLIINGEIKHQGCVPKLHQIEEWLLELRN